MRIVITRGAAVVLFAAMSAAGCVRASARTPPLMPALAVPAPPPRLVEPIADLEAPVEPPPGTEPLASPAESEASRPAPTANTRPTTTTDATPPESPPPDARPETPPAVVSSPPPVLQTIPAVRESDVERQIQAQLDQAQSNLKRVDYRNLTPNARANYDQANRFIRQAQDALRTKNFVFAETVAGKAATLAAQLAGR